MAPTRRPRVSTLHDFKLGELLQLAVQTPPLHRRTIVQVIGFRGDGIVRVLPLGGAPTLVPYAHLLRVGLPCGAAVPPRRRYRKRRARAA